MSGEGGACREERRPCFSPHPIRSRAMRGLSGAPTPPALVLLGGPKLEERVEGTPEEVTVGRDCVRWPPEPCCKLYILRGGSCTAWTFFMCARHSLIKRNTCPHIWHLRILSKSFLDSITSTGGLGVAPVPARPLTKLWGLGDGGVEVTGDRRDDEPP